VPAAGGLVMAYGIGAIAGPPVAVLSIEFFGAVGLFFSVELLPRVRPG